MNVFTSLFGKSAKFNTTVVVRKFSKNDPPKNVSVAPVIKVKVSPHDDALPMHGGSHKKLRKSPAVKKRSGG